MQGRVAFTADINAGAEAREAGMTLFASAPVTAASVEAWHLPSIWVDAPAVLAARKGEEA